MIIHVVGAVEKLLKVLKANRQTNGKANGRPQGIASTHPIPEAKHVCAIDAKGGHLFLVGGQSYKVLSNGLRLQMKLNIN